MMRIGALAAIALTAALLRAAPDAPKFTPDGELRFPDGYRNWVFLSSGLGMAYGTNAASSGRPPRFTNVFVNPTAHRHFLKTGRWPEGSMFILEIRESSSEGSINRGGHYQSKIAAVEVEVKDTRRFPSGWAYFDFGATAKASAPALGPKASCPACHSTNGAVENTFVQFYPSLIDVARAKGTWRVDAAGTAKGH